MPEQINPRFGIVDGVSQVVWACSLYPAAVVLFVYGIWFLCFLLYGHSPHSFRADDPHPRLVRELASILSVTGMFSLFFSLAVLPLNALFVLIELLQRLFHRRRDVILLLLIPTLTWLLCFGIIRWSPSSLLGWSLD